MIREQDSRRQLQAWASGFAEVLGQGLFGMHNVEQKEYDNDIHDRGTHLVVLLSDASRANGAVHAAA